MPLKRPSRFHRLDRDPVKYHIEDDTGHLWAVSYADFLMVLLSFFILFFSVNSKDKNTIINIVAKVRERGLGAGNGGGGVGAVPNRQINSVTANPKAIAEAIRLRIQNLKFEVNDKDKTVTFMLDDEVFKPGGIVMSAQGTQDLSGLLDLLKPYANDVDLIFVGHTDPRPVRMNRIAAVENNFDLSALRASQAVKLAMKQGLPKESLFTHGSADNTRPTKSLSLVIVEKGGGRI